METFLVSLDTAKFLMRLNYHFDTPLGYYYCDGTPLYLDNETLDYFKKTNTRLWQTTTVMAIRQWLKLEKNINVELCLKTKKGDNFIYEVNIIDLIKRSVINSITVDGTYIYAMKKGVEQICYSLSK